MNERIRELAEQATTKVEYYPPSRNGYPEYRYDFDQEKFAELIINECADIASINGFQVEPPGYYVRKHFGVE